MLHNSLKHLMEDVGCDGKEYIGKWERLPEWMIHGLEFRFMTCRVKNLCVLISQKINISHIVEISEREVFEVTKLIAWDGALWTAAIEGTCYESLLWIITNKGG
jgi:hypothetical protein